MVKLADLRKKQNLSQSEFAKIVGVSDSLIALYETGQRTPSLKMAKRIAGYFNTPIEEIEFKTR